MKPILATGTLGCNYKDGIQEYFVSQDNAQETIIGNHPFFEYGLRKLYGKKVTFEYVPKENGGFLLNLTPIE
jgi:hypothetical protein